MIVATALEENGEVVLRIRDTGIGMTEKDIETAMKPFRQVATTGTRRDEGTGLGLPLTKALVEANRADLRHRQRPQPGHAGPDHLPDDAGAGGLDGCRLRLARTSLPRSEIPSAFTLREAREYRGSAIPGRESLGNSTGERSSNDDRILLAVVLTLCSSMALAASWRSYHNERFGATADVPADWRAGEPPENGDGLAFTSPDGRATITVYGGLNISGSLAEVLATRAAPNDGETVTYIHRDRHGVVVSGTRGDVIFYRKSIFACRNQVWDSVSIEYPAAEKKAYDVGQPRRRLAQAGRQRAGGGVPLI